MGRLPLHHVGPQNLNLEAPDRPKNTFVLQLKRRKTIKDPSQFEECWIVLEDDF